MFKTTNIFLTGLEKIIVFVSDGNIFNELHWAQHCNVENLIEMWKKQINC